MKDTRRFLGGQITRESSGKGVLGLTIELLTGEGRKQSSVYQTLTRENGSFLMPPSAWPGSKRAQLESGKILFRIKDRDGNVLLETEKPPLGDKSSEFNFTIEDKQLANHESRPLLWERPRGRIVPGEKIAEVKEAFESIFSDHEPPASKRDVVRPIPLIDRFEKIQEDAWDALQGDPDATLRFADALKLIKHTQPASSLRTKKSLSESEFTTILSKMKDIVTKQPRIEGIELLDRAGRY